MKSVVITMKLAVITKEAVALLLTVRFAESAPKRHVMVV